MDESAESKVLAESLFVHDNTVGAEPDTGSDDERPTVPSLKGKGRGKKRDTPFPGARTRAVEQDPQSDRRPQDRCQRPRSAGRARREHPRPARRPRAVHDQYPAHQRRAPLLVTGAFAKPRDWIDARSGSSGRDRLRAD